MRIRLEERGTEVVDKVWRNCQMLESAQGLGFDCIGDYDGVRDAGYALQMAISFVRLILLTGNEPAWLGTARLASVTTTPPSYQLLQRLCETFRPRAYAFCVSASYFVFLQFVLFAITVAQKD